VKGEETMPGPFNSGDEEDVTFDEVSGMADRLGLQGEARQNYIHDHMLQLGYDPVQSRESYVRRQEQEEQPQSTSRWGFGGGGGGRQQGRQNQSRGSGSRRDDGDTF
jgi:hypothetical protein